ncbi:NFACT RNA binding domain-containing protein [Limisalsivibrio acetivorans]|uniref:NFACT RNA binding domain-containing protein n=1 Tax=Limisalsivibrio acetivorans TaxID=1304888 RepID=UPI0003B4EA0D|nr:NFACT RNA binding domain-containing protein [Limisalsivibrio acetivorans]
MDGLTLTKLVHITGPKLRGSRLNRVTVTDDSLYFSLFGEGQMVLRVRTGDGVPALLKAEKPDGAVEKRLETLNGATLKSLGCRKYDRVMHMELLKRRPSGKIVSYRVICELIGRMANIFVTDENGIVIYMHSRNNPDPDRDIGIGSVYTEPKMNKRYSLDNPPPVEDFSLMTGFYPLTVKYAESIMNQKEFSFMETCIYIKSCIYDDAKFYADARSKLVPFPAPGAEREVSAEELESFFTVSREKRKGRAKDRLLSFYAKQRKKYASLMKELQEELKRAEEWKGIQAEAELVRDNMHLLERGEGEMTLNRYTEEGVEEVSYSLPEGVHPRERMDKLFARSAKLERSINKINNRMEEVRQLLMNINEQIYFIEESAGERDLLELEEEMNAKSRTGKKQQYKEKQFLTFSMNCGKAYAGRNSVSNHRLVFGYANPDDLWFHAQKIPSSHLILRCDESPTEEDIIRAARIVAGYSKAKHDTKVVVDYTRKKHVKKPKNTPPGFVIYHKFSSVTVEPMSEEELLDESRNQ